MILAEKALLGKVPVEVEVTIADTWAKNRQSQPQLHDGVGCKM